MIILFETIGQVGLIVVLLLIAWLLLRLRARVRRMELNALRESAT
jgi:hypothetical protein